MSRDTDLTTDGWLSALEQRHLADLTRREAARALAALSTCYVQRREKLGEGGALSSAGKRAAFALYYGPQHFVLTSHVIQSLAGAKEAVDTVVDLGCGTGSAGAAWARAAGAHAIRGFDIHPWATSEASWTYRQFQLDGRAVRANLTSLDARNPATRALASSRRGTGILAAYAVNELSPDGRSVLLPALLDAHRRGARVLVIEPIARRLSGVAGWWDDWQAQFERAGGRADEWRFAAPLPSISLALARAAGLDPRELTARSLFL